jgi:hypothetical protein
VSLSSGDAARLTASEVGVLLRRALRNICLLRLCADGERSALAVPVRVVFVLDKFERFASAERQNTLYTLLNLGDKRGINASVVALAGIPGVRETLEKRVLSRFQAPQVFVPAGLGLGLSSETPPSAGDLVRAMLTLPAGALAHKQAISAYADIGGDVARWNAAVDSWCAHDALRSCLEEDLRHTADVHLVAGALASCGEACARRGRHGSPGEVLERYARMREARFHYDVVSSSSSSLSSRGHVGDAYDAGEAASSAVLTLSSLSTVEWAVVGAMRVLRDDRQRPVATLRSILKILSMLRKSAAKNLPEMGIAQLSIAAVSLLETGLVVALGDVRGNPTQFTLLLLDCLRDHMDAALRREGVRVPTDLRNFILGQ